MQIRLPSSISDCIAAAGGEVNLVGRMESLAELRRLLFQIEIRSLQIRAYVTQDDATVEHLSNELLALRNLVESSIREASTIAAVSAETFGSA